MTLPVYSFVLSCELGDAVTQAMSGYVLCDITALQERPAHVNDSGRACIVAQRHVLSLTLDLFTHLLVGRLGKG